MRRSRRSDAHPNVARLIARHVPQQSPSRRRRRDGHIARTRTRPSPIHRSPPSATISIASHGDGNSSARCKRPLIMRSAGLCGVLPFGSIARTDATKGSRHNQRCSRNVSSAVGLEPPRRRRHRREFAPGFLLHREVGLHVHVSRLQALVAKPAGDDGAVHASVLPRPSGRFSRIVPSWSRIRPSRPFG